MISLKHALLLLFLTWIVQSTATTSEEPTTIEAVEDTKPTAVSAASRLFHSAVNTLTDYANRFRSALFDDVDDYVDDELNEKSMDMDAADQSDEDQFGYDPYFQPGYDVKQQYHAKREPNSNSRLSVSTLIICSLFKLIL